MIRRTVIAMLASAMLAGCVSNSQPAPTYNFDAPNKAVKSAIVSIYSSDGFTVFRDSQFQIVMQRIRGGAALRHSFSIVGSNPVAVTGNISVANNPGSGFEQSSDFTWDGGARALMDGYMQRVRAMIGQ